MLKGLISGELVYKFIDMNFPEYSRKTSPCPAGSNWRQGPQGHRAIGATSRSQLENGCARFWRRRQADGADRRENTRMRELARRESPHTRAESIVAR